jgi:hypothetical protein
MADDSERDKMPIRVGHYPIVLMALPFGILSEEHAKHLHGQSLARLAERGGLSPHEAICHLRHIGLWDREPGGTVQDLEELRTLVQAALPLEPLPEKRLPTLEECLANHTSSNYLVLPDGLSVFQTKARELIKVWRQTIAVRHVRLSVGTIMPPEDQRLFCGGCGRLAPGISDGLCVSCQSLFNALTKD